MEKRIDMEINLYMNALIKKQKEKNMEFYSKQRQLSLLYDNSLKNTTEKTLVKKLNTKA